MSELLLPDAQVHRGHETRIALVVLDGLGGLPHPETGSTELEAARTPNLDALADRSSLGVLDPVGRGITPGSGPGHLSLFGYDPTEYVIGRGVLSALGVDIELQAGDLAARLNIATFDATSGSVMDRRAGRPSDAEGRRVVDKLMAGFRQPEGHEVSLTHEKEHRVVLLIRGGGLEADLADTDPLETDVPDLECVAGSPGSELAASLVRDFLAQARDILGDEPTLNGFLARGFATFQRIPTVEDRFGLSAIALAKYPMYRGVAKLVGMEVPGVPSSVGETVSLYETYGGGTGLSFLHFKDTDTRGHDADFDGKVAAIEEVDGVVPRIVAQEPDVLIFTGDHSTPALYGEHSWHSVPVLLSSAWARPTGGGFGETACRRGDLGRFHGTELLSLALAHAGRLVKYGA